MALPPPGLCPGGAGEGTPHRAESITERGCPGGELLMNQLFTYHGRHQGAGGPASLYGPWLHLPYPKRPYHARWGDGEELTDGEFQSLSDLYAEHAVTVPLASGELVVVNNFRWTHGRDSYEGERDILVMMSKAVTRQTQFQPTRSSVGRPRPAQGPPAGL